eukprot:c20686_g1_i1.p1 GENE.c20686_g1_i1~~c20686_g1_i1.p1  ORF type:complete len:562 (+),score=127.00 c20686_g1_i1:286-1971(+)
MLPKLTPPPKTIILLFRWLAFRLLIGAGMSKIGGNSSACWKELSCTQTHYETQPMPNPIAWWMHRAPDAFHTAEVALTFVEQLVLPFIMLLPFRSTRIFAAISEMMFQLLIVGTGNYAWINWIGALPCLAFLDDDFLRVFFSNTDGVRDAATTPPLPKSDSKVSRIFHESYRMFRKFLHAGVFCMICYLSKEPIKELFSQSPWLHIYDKYFLVSSQGVFGFINQERIVLVLEYTHDSIVLPPSCSDSTESLGNGHNGQALFCHNVAHLCDSPQYKSLMHDRCPMTCAVHRCSGGDLNNVTWKTLDFKNLPGTLDRRPYFNSPYHYRLDWEVWIHTTARMEGRQGQLAVPDFVQRFISKILAGDTDAAGLVGTPVEALFTETLNRPPTAISAKYYRYHFSNTGETAWWQRERVEGHRTTLHFANRTNKNRTQVRRETGWRLWQGFWSTVGLVVCVVNFARQINNLQNGAEVVVIRVTAVAIFCWALYVSVAPPTKTGPDSSQRIFQIVAAALVATLLAAVLIRSTGAVQIVGPALDVVVLLAVVGWCCFAANKEQRQLDLGA